MEQYNDIRCIGYTCRNILTNVDGLDHDFSNSFNEWSDKKKSINNRSDYILLSDQDTIYPKKYIIDMIEAIHKLDNNIAAIAPLYKDLNKRDSDTGFIKKSFTGVKRFYPDSGFHEIYQAIASGKILITKHLSKINLMDEKLFIDRVDMEWCWRAINKGYKIIGNANVVIGHYMGDKAINIGIKMISLRSPIRTYYMTRNDVHLALRFNRLDFVHRIVIFLKAVRFLVVMPLLAKPHFEHLKYALLGFRHGLTGKLGKLNGTS